MEQAEAWTRQSGGRAVCLRSNVVREGAHEFYRRLGYETGEDVVHVSQAG